MIMKILVKATSFFGGSRRRPGDVLNVPDDLKGDWFDTVADDPPVGKARQTRQPSGPGKPAGTSEGAGDLV